MPEYIYIILIALPVALITFSAAFWGGVYQCLCFSEKMKMAVAFAVFQTLMFWLATWTGNSFANSLGWLSIPMAEAILMLTALKFIYAAFRTRPEQKSYNLAKNGELIAVSFAASLNAFMIGLGFGLLRPVSTLTFYIIPAAVILFAYLGDYLGKRNGKMGIIRFAGIVASISILCLGLILALDLYEIL